MVHGECRIRPLAPGLPLNYHPAQLDGGWSVAVDGVQPLSGGVAQGRLLGNPLPTKRIATAMTSVSPAPRPSRGYLAVIRSIDKFTEWTGYLFVLFIIPLIFANVVEVFARYVLKEPTIWALDVTTMSYAALFMLGSALALLKGAHVRTDMLWEAFSDRTKGMIDSLAFVLFFLPTMAVLFFISIDDFLYSVSIDERGSSGAWTPVLWPLRGVIPLASFMLFLQGISELMKSLWAWRNGEFLTKHEKIEV